ncbi:MAG: transglycosylase SLT domain-containing protein [Gemmatimonadota bacterium]|nr:transglycosylase SLT domain-containing protein [Gemmatimonadota bacterium]
MRRRGKRLSIAGAGAGVAVHLLAAAALAGQGLPARTSIDEARSLLDLHMPVSAGALLAAELSRGAAEGDEAVLVAGRAYVEQRSWASARRLLAGREFTDPEAERTAALLLARAYAGLDSAARAADAFARYLDGRADPPPLAVRVEYAEALSGAGRRAPAIRELERAISEHPDLARWIRLSRLHALVEAGDSAAFPLADSLVGEVPTDSAFLPAARLAFESGDADRGLRLTRRAGEEVRAALAAEHIAPALVARGDTSGAIDAYRTALDEGRASAETAPALLALDRSWEALRAAGSSDRRAGRNERAGRYLEVALDLAPESEKREVAEELATALAAAGEPGRALDVLEPWLSGEAATPSDDASTWLIAAGLYRARGDGYAADRAFQRAAAGRGPPASRAAYLIADAHHDAARPDEARFAFERAYERFPGTSYGSRSLERLALLHFREGRYDAARARLEEYRRRYPRGGWVQGALYWSAKTEEARGDSAAARDLYRRTVEYDPLDYYAILAAPRAGVDRWAALRLDGSVALPALDPVHADALDRMNRLRDAGWVERARAEYREARSTGPVDAGHILAFARALNADGWTREGIAAGWRAKSKTPRWSRPLLEAIYPLPFPEALAAAARDRGLAPHFVAGVSRRESMFDPEIRSVANAVGLMQLLPRTARDVASRAGLPEYRRAQLTVPEVNLLLGTRYLADVLDRFDGSPLAGMISYNAGPHRWVRWREFPEFSDPEQLVERIPFRETREYVRAVIELSEIYRFLYPDLEPPVP